MTLDAVARRAGVSTATVSRVLNSADGVRPDTRARVLAAAAALHYTPDLNARALAGATSRALGVVVSNVANPFFLDIVQSVEDGARAHGYEVIVANTDYSPDRLAAAVTAMLGRRVAGLALVVSETVPPVVGALRRRARGAPPVVLYDGGAHGLRGVPNVRADYAAGMARVVEHLRTLGHARMAFLGHHTRLGPLHDRREAFLAAAAAHAPGASVATVESTDGFAGGRAGVRQLLDSGFRPTAIACANDLLAVGAIRELRDRGLTVPGDVSVTGFDDVALAEYAEPPLTTVDVPRAAIGRLVCEALLAPSGAPPRRARKGAPNAPPTEVVVGTTLVVRASTGRAPPAPR